MMSADGACGARAHLRRLLRRIDPRVLRRDARRRRDDPHEKPRGPLHRGRGVVLPHRAPRSESKTGRGGAGFSEDTLPSAGARLVTLFRDPRPRVHSSAALEGPRPPARACRAMARRPPQLGLGLDLDASASSLRTSMSTDLGASYNLTSEGVRLLSASQREFHLHAAGHETRTAADRVAAARSGTVAPETRAGSGPRPNPAMKTVSRRGFRANRPSLRTARRAT